MFELHWLIIVLCVLIVLLLFFVFFGCLARVGFTVDWLFCCVFLWLFRWLFYCKCCCVLIFGLFWLTLFGWYYCRGLLLVLFADLPRLNLVFVLVEVVYFLVAWVCFAWYCDLVLLGSFLWAGLCCLFCWILWVIDWLLCFVDCLWLLSISVVIVGLYGFVVFGHVTILLVCWTCLRWFGVADIRLLDLLLIWFVWFDFWCYEFNDFGCGCFFWLVSGCWLRGFVFYVYLLHLLFWWFSCRISGLLLWLFFFYWFVWRCCAFGFVDVLLC